MEKENPDSKKRSSKLTAIIAGAAISIAALTSGCEYMVGYSTYPSRYHGPIRYRSYPPQIRGHVIIPSPRFRGYRQFNNGPYGNYHYRSIPRSHSRINPHRR